MGGGLINCPLDRLASGGRLALQLSQVASSAAVDGSSQTAAEDGDEQAQQAQQAADLAAGILESVATDPAHGLCRAGAAAGVTLAAAVGAELTPGKQGTATVLLLARTLYIGAALPVPGASAKARQRCTVSLGPA